MVNRKVLLMIFHVISIINAVAITAFIPPSCKRHVPTLRYQHQQSRVVAKPPFSSGRINLATSKLIEQTTATSAIIVPALAGLSMDRFFHRISMLNKLQGLGALLTILAASILSTLGYCSSSSPIHELCWTRLLPASLSLWLIASTVEEENLDTPPSKDAWGELIAVSIPFVIGCIGSVLGCLLSFTLCCMGRSNTTRVHTHVLPGRHHFFFRPGHLLLGPAEAAVAAGCLCSAYIGGPWNYFESMRILVRDERLPPFAKDAVQHVLGGTFGSSASDLLVMPIYFSVLQSMVCSKQINKMFPGRYTMNDRIDYGNLLEDSSVLTVSDNDKFKNLRTFGLIFSALIIPTVWVIVAFSYACESSIGIPGFGIAMNSLLSCTIPALFSQIYRLLLPRREKHPLKLFATEVQKVTSRLSDICYYMLLSVIGVSSNLRREIFDGGWAPSSSFIFSSIALLVHFAIIVVGSFGVMRAFPRFKQFPLRPEEVAVASCAAITGPQAAVSLALKLSEENGSIQPNTNTINWRALILSATVVGVVGYIISCSVGVSLSKFLLHLTEKRQWYA